MSTIPKWKQLYNYVYSYTYSTTVLASEDIHGKPSTMEEPVEDEVQLEDEVYFEGLVYSLYIT